MMDVSQNTQFSTVREAVRTLQPIEPLYCLHPRRIESAARAFVTSFPGRTLFALKCNPHPRVVEALVAGGIDAFDTASLQEIRQIREAHPSADCFFMNPVKPRAAIRTARYVYGVSHFVVDHPDELSKLVDELGSDPDVTVVVRFSTERSADATFHLADKFGAPHGMAIELLKSTKTYGFKAGVAFHVGSQCRRPDAYRIALLRMREILETADVPIDFIDVGGGFPATYAETNIPDIESFIETIRLGLNNLHVAQNCVVAAEPGRALVAEGCTLIVRVNLRKGQCLYINDGIFGSLNEIYAAGLKLSGEIIRFDAPVIGNPETFDFAGPTCDSLDMLPGVVDLPCDIREGDWIALHCMGAYSSTLATNFNGFQPKSFVEIIPREQQI